MGRAIRTRWASLRREQSGAAVVIVALMLTMLLGLAAFAVDFGWLYWNVIKIQHGADAAALSGVIYEPSNQALAYQHAREAAQENGYQHGFGGTTVIPVDFADDPSAVSNSNQLRVTVRDTVPTFFMSVFGYDEITISKYAIAEYVLPLAMGSDLPYFGTDPELGHAPNFWANIHGYYAAKQWGDRFAAQCQNGESGDSGCGANDEARPTSTFAGPGGTHYTGGYVYGIEVDETSGPLTVEVFDGPFYKGGDDHFLVGDEDKGTDGPTTVFQLYAPDPTPLETSDNTVVCTVVYPPVPIENHFANFDGDNSLGSDAGAGLWNADPEDDQNGDGYFDWSDITDAPGITIGDLWDPMCGSYTDPGVYSLRVTTVNPGASGDFGLNRYSLRTSTAGGPNARMFGLGDMAIYANFPGEFTTFDLAEVKEVHGGKDLVIELWDPDSGNEGVKILDPNGDTPDCTWSATDGRGSSTPSACHITYGSSFHNHLMTIRVSIDNDYACGTDCWWQIEVEYDDDGSQDTTTWSAHIEGNPVRLVE